MKSIFQLCLVSLLFPLVLVSCTDSKLRVAEGSPYTLSGIIMQADSAAADSFVTLLIDRHEISSSVMGDTLAACEVVQLPVVDGAFSYQGHTPLDADELCLYDGRGHVARLYGLSGAKLNVQLLANGDVVQDAVDTTDILRTLLLRDSIGIISDSLYVRRRLGGLPESARPAWLMQSINQMLDRKSQALGKATRLPRVDVQTSDTVFQLLGNRPESLLLIFWSMEDSLSRDSLQVMKSIARDYGLYDHAATFATEKSATRRPKAHRIELMSVCMQCDDSAAWRSAVKDLPGHHAILPGGYAHPLAMNCQIEHLPWMVLVDRFGNYQKHNMAGDELYEWLDKTPLNSTVNNKLKK